MRAFASLRYLFIAVPLFVAAASVAAAPHMCAIGSNEDFSKTKMSELKGRFCSTLLMAALANEEGKLIGSKLDSQKWNSANKTEQEALMARGISLLAERNMCLATAAKAKETYLQRFKHEPKCG